MPGRQPPEHRASANQNVTNNILHKKPEEWPPLLAHNLRHGERAKEQSIPNKTFKACNGARSLTTRDTSYNHVRQSTFIRTLKSSLNQSKIPLVNTWWSVRKACETVIAGGEAKSSARGTPFALAFLSLTGFVPL